MKELLEKYYNGETTEQEEARLREWMLYSDLPEVFADDQTLFSQLETEKGTMTPTSRNLEEKLKTLIDNAAAKERKTNGKGKTRNLKRLAWWVTGIAAGAAMLLTITRQLTENTPVAMPVSYIREVSDPQEAAMYVDFAMKKFSTAMNSSRLQLQKAENTLQKLLLIK